MMVVGTSSHAGKSWMTTAICRSLHRRGVRVAPFKAQNMSLNSFPCAGGGEIGRAQVAQAEACGLAPLADMNPILLKPTAHDASQVIVNGRVWKQLSARDYYTHYEFLLGQVMAAFERLAGQFEFIVMEGAGSASEINLRSRDLVNLPLALRVRAPAMLVADIDRGGVFASVAGTFALLEPCEKELLRSFVINRFRGDRAVFAGGCEMLEQLAGRPCLGVFPYAEDIRIDDEDIVSLEEIVSLENGAASTEGAASDQTVHGLRVVIVRLPRISNFTDFRLLSGARYITEPSSETPDCIILPGSKNTLDDLLWMRRRGLDRWMLDCHARGASVWGICGGYQMLGRRISDPGGVESSGGSMQGLGLLPIETVMLEEKTTRVVRAKCALNGVEFQAYEIHMGETRRVAETNTAGGGEGAQPAAECFAWIDGKPEGCCGGGIAGTYLHGALEVPEVLGSMLAEVARRRGRAFDPSVIQGDSKQQHYDRLADWFEQHVDRPRFEELYLG
jgi:adenosylcobyric acid synthase